MSLAEPDEDVVGDWTLVDADLSLLGNKAGATRLGFALTLKFFEHKTRFPDSAEAFSLEVVSYVAKQVGVDETRLQSYELPDRTATRHRAQIRAYELGHLLLEHEFSGSLIGRDHQRLFDKSKKKQANFMAGEFLIPEAAVRKAAFEGCRKSEYADLIAMTGYQDIVRVS